MIMGNKTKNEIIRELDMKRYCDRHIKKYIKARESELYRLFKLDGMNIEKLFKWIYCRELYGEPIVKNKYKLFPNKPSRKEIDEVVNVLGISEDAMKKGSLRVFVLYVREFFKL